MIRMMEPGSNIVSSMIDGACREDFNQVPPKLPFDIKLRTMVCYKAWKRTVIEVDQKLPVQIESDDEEGEGEGGEGDADAGADGDGQATDSATSSGGGTGGDDAESTGISDADLGLDSCWNVHPVVCDDYQKHPLIKERGNFYL